jgi:hypothetical protein
MSGLKEVYWTVGDLVTYSKVQALYWAKGDKSKIKFYFFDKEWENNNWGSPPVKSLQQLIKERCEYLRSQTNHLALWLSSGYDSGTVLDNFVLYNMPIDELCVFKRSDDDPEFPLALAKAQYYKDNHNANVIITEVDLGISHIKKYYERNDDPAFWETGLNVRINKTSMVNVGDRSKTVHSPNNKFSDRLDICGIEKPRVTLYKNNWYAMMPDSSLTDAIGTCAKGFWLDVDSWELYHCACWSVIRWMETLPNLDENLVHIIQSNSTEYYIEWNMSIGRTPITNKFSKTAANKKLYRPGMMSPSTLKAIQYFQQYDKKIWNHYEHNLLTLQKIVGREIWSDISHDFPISSFTICSESKFLKPLKLSHKSSVV